MKDFKIEALRELLQKGKQDQVDQLKHKLKVQRDLSEDPSYSVFSDHDKPINSAMRDARFFANHAAGVNPSPKSYLPTGVKLLDAEKSDYAQGFIEHALDPKSASNPDGENILTPRQLMEREGFSEQEMHDSYDDIAGELGKLRMSRLKRSPLGWED